MLQIKLSQETVLSKAWWVGIIAVACFVFDLWLSFTPLGMQVWTTLFPLYKRTGQIGVLFLLFFMVLYILVISLRWLILLLYFGGKADKMTGYAIWTTIQITYGLNSPRANHWSLSMIYFCLNNSLYRTEQKIISHWRASQC